ncbi:hypothetical protein PIROE2DRAFT_11963 [Piromyces sp. E2]|nr:hypothetical protein PIROE2DRAFT_11963 [Piromyces sp. E2]|eukprot:OUM61900.1 hypothetical protein PIROE2DRAFT_11963 [Piromyces sp. E2]
MVLNQRQIRWSIFLSKFDFWIFFRQGIISGKLDILSRRSNYKSNKTADNKAIFSENNFCLATSENIKELINAQKKDSFCRNTILKIKENSNNK